MVAKDEMLSKIAKRLGQGEPPCDSCLFIDEVADFCDEQYCSDLCDPTECWYKVLKKGGDRRMTQYEILYGTAVEIAKTV